MSNKNRNASILSDVIQMLNDGVDYVDIKSFIEDYQNYSEDDFHDNDSDNGYSYSEQRSSDVLDYTRALYESGRIDYMQMQEMRVGA